MLVAHRTLRRVVLVVLALTAIASVAACGDDEATTVTDTVTVPTAPAGTPPTGPAGEADPATGDDGQDGGRAPGSGPESEGMADPPEGAGAGPVSCGTVPFQANSDAGAFDVTARGVGCETARQVAEGARAGALRYSRQGFRCVGTPREGELASVSFRCTDGGRSITFTAS